MESLKPILLLLVLSGVGYGVYVALNHAPPPEPPPGVTNPPSQATADDRGAAGRTPENSADPSPASAAGNPWNTGVTSTENRAASPDSTNTAASTAGSATAGFGSLPFGIGSANGAAAASSPPSISDAPSSGETTQGMPPSPGAAAASAAPMSPVPAQVPADNFVPSDGRYASSPATAPAASPPATTSEADAQAQARHDYEAAMRAAQTDLNQGKLVDALREMSRWYDQAIVPPEDQQRLVDLLGQLAGTVIYSRQSYLGPPYVVRAGESLESIARDCQVPWQLLAKINGQTTPNGLIPGQEIKILRGPFQAQLNAQGQWLALFVDGLYAGRFRVQMDAPLAKPEGSYPVVKFPANSAAQTAAAAPYISLGGDLHLRVSTDAAAAGEPVVRISPQDMGDVYDILSERSEVTIRR